MVATVEAWVRFKYIQGNQVRYTPAGGTMLFAHCHPAQLLNKRVRALALQVIWNDKGWSAGDMHMQIYSGRLGLGVNGYVGRVKAHYFFCWNVARACFSRMLHRF